MATIVIDKNGHLSARNGVDISNVSQSSYTANGVCVNKVAFGNAMVEITNGQVTKTQGLRRAAASANAPPPLAAGKLSRRNLTVRGKGSLVLDASGCLKDVSGFALAYDDTTGEVSVVDDRDSSGPTLEICGERYVFRTPRYYLMLELATDDHSFDEIHVQCKAALRIQKPDCVQQISASVKASVTVEADQAFLGSITADTSATVTVLRAVTVGEQTLELVASVYTRGQIIIRGRVAAALCDASASTKGRVEIEKAKEVELRADTYGVVTAKGTKCIKNKFDGGGAITFHRCTH